MGACRSSASPLSSVRLCVCVCVWICEPSLQATPAMVIAPPYITDVPTLSLLLGILSLQRYNTHSRYHPTTLGLVARRTANHINFTEPHSPRVHTIQHPAGRQPHTVLDSSLTCPLVSQDYTPQLPLHKQPACLCVRETSKAEKPLVSDAQLSLYPQRTPSL